MGIKCQSFRDFFSEKRANAFGKGQRRFQHTQIHCETKSLGTEQNGQTHDSILLAALFAATNNEAIIIIW